MAHLLGFKGPFARGDDDDDFYNKGSFALDDNNKLDTWRHRHEWMLHLFVRRHPQFKFVLVIKCERAPNIQGTTQQFGHNKTDRITNHKAFERGLEWHKSGVAPTRMLQCACSARVQYLLRLSRMRRSRDPSSSSSSSSPVKVLRPPQRFTRWRTLASLGLNRTLCRESDLGLEENPNSNSTVIYHRSKHFFLILTKCFKTPRVFVTKCKERMMACKKYKMNKSFIAHFFVCVCVCVCVCVLGNSFRRRIFQSTTDR